MTADISKYLRLATDKDIGVLVQMTKNFIKSTSEYRSIEISHKKLYDTITGIVKGDQTQGVALIALKEGKPVGMILGAANSPLFSEQKIAMELAWYIEPKHRKSRASLLLFRAYEDWAYRVGCDYVQMAYLSNTSNELLDQLYRRQGYTQVEVSYMKEIK